MQLDQFLECGLYKNEVLGYGSFVEKRFKVKDHKGLHFIRWNPSISFGKAAK